MLVCNTLGPCRTTNLQDCSDSGGENRDQGLRIGGMLHEYNSAVASVAAQRVRQLRNRRNWSQRTLGERAGVSHSTVSRLERGITHQSDLETLAKLYRALGETLELGDIVPSTPPPPHIFGAVAELIVQEQTVSAGFGIWSDTQERYFVAAEDARGRRLVAARVTGDCMEPDLAPGDLVIFDMGRLEPNEDEAVVCTTEDGQVLVKWFKRDDQGVLLLDNKGIEYRLNGLKIEGTVYGSFRHQPRRRRSP